MQIGGNHTSSCLSDLYKAVCLTAASAKISVYDSMTQLGASTSMQILWNPNPNIYHQPKDSIIRTHAISVQEHLRKLHMESLHSGAK